MPEHAPPVFVHDPYSARPEVPYEMLWFQVCNKVTGLSSSGPKQASAARSYYKLNKPVEAVWLASFPPKRAVAPLSVERPLRFAQFGRLHPQKNPLLTLEAFARLAASGLQAELHFFGDGPLREKCRMLAAQLSLGEAVTFHGAYSNEELDDLIESIDVGLMPSKFEGFGIVMLELISRGRPVIATDVGGAREVLEGMECGWVIDKSDAGDLFTAMARCCKERAAVAERGNACRSRWLEHFTPGKMFDRMAGFWRSCGVPVPDENQVD
jgi:glycosyltransferase involved in cell wall biosynthesis